MTEETMITKVVDTEVKEIADRVLEFIGSTEKQDRDGEVIKADGWDLKNYKKNPVFMWAHDYRQPPIGKTNRVWVDNGTLKFKVEFAPPETYEFADTIYKLYKGGFLKATSVGFVPKEWSDGDGEKAPRRTYSKQELLELSGVPVPSNPDALMTARDSGVITVKEFEQMGGLVSLEDALKYAVVGAAITKPEETEDYIRIPVPKEEGKHEGHRIRTITISEEKGIKALYCGECKRNITYLFAKDKGWTMESAQEWVDEHKEAKMGKNELKGVSQAEIMDQLDYVIKLIKSEGMNEDVEEDAWNLVREVMRLPGSDIPVDIQAKIGAVLNQKNKERLQQIQHLAQEILDSAEHEPEPDKDKPKEPSKGDIAKMIGEAVKREFGRLQGKVY